VAVLARSSKAGAVVRLSLSAKVLLIDASRSVVRREVSCGAAHCNELEAASGAHNGAMRLRRAR
jgi:hypothetical protein